jgi:ribosomal protein L7/L12
MSREIQIPTEALAALARGDRIEAVKRVREANPGMDLRGAMQAVDAHYFGGKYVQEKADLQVHYAAQSGLPEAAVAAIARSQLVEAIKIVKEATGLGLKESKDLVDQHREVLSAASVSMPNHKSPSQAGRGDGSVVGGTRTTSTISTESSRHGWWWALGLISCFAVAWFWLGR